MNNSESYWQICPKCHGNKIVFALSTTITIKCDICNGYGILNIFSGLPPKGKSEAENGEKIK